MHSLLGVPIVSRGRAWGTLYLTDKRTGEFTEDDEYAATTLAMWAAIAVDHARLLAGAAERQGSQEAAPRAHVDPLDRHRPEVMRDCAAVR